MKRTNTITALLLAMVLLLSCGMRAASADQIIKVQVKAEFRYDDARKMLTMINQFRKGKDAWYWDQSNKKKIKVKGLKDLQYDYALERVAMQRALEIAAYFNHTRPDGSSWSTAFPGGYSAKGENLVYGYGSAKAAFNALAEKDKKYSGQGHRRNMLRKEFTKVGFGAVKVGNTMYWAQSFGTGKSGSASKSDSNRFKEDKIRVSTDLMIKNAQNISTEVETLTVVTGDSVSLPRVVIYSNSGARLYLSDCSWKSKNQQIVKIKSKKVTGVSEGTTVLETSVGGKKLKLPAQVTAKVTTDDIGIIIDDYDPALAPDEYLILMEDDECFELGDEP